MTEITLDSLSLIFGLALLIWSAHLVVNKSTIVANHFGMPPLLIGMFVIGFGTSFPELATASFAALNGKPEIALGSVYGSNIAIIALILGIVAIINPITVNSRILRQELPILVATAFLSAWLIWDGKITRSEALILLAAFAGIMALILWLGLKEKSDELGLEVKKSLAADPASIRGTIVWLIVGIALLLLSSSALVEGASGIARHLGVSDLVIGLTIVALGTSLPELASAIIATKKGEHDIAIGNVIGSNIFNALAVVGIAGLIHPMTAPPEIITRDVSVMVALTVALFLMGFALRRPGRINRFEGFLLLTSYIVYIAYLAHGSFS